MRPWLTVVGVVFLTLGIGTVATLYFAGADNPTTTTIITAPPRFSLTPHETDVIALGGSNGSSEQFHFTWQSSGPLAVRLEQSGACTSSCPDGPDLLTSWSANESGSWYGTGPFRFPVDCVLTNNQTAELNVTLASRAESTTPSHPTLLFELVLGGGGAALVVVGGLAVFLGVFLRSDPYGPDPPVVSHSPDDVNELDPGGPSDH